MILLWHNLIPCIARQGCNGSYFGNVFFLVVARKRGITECSLISIIIMKTCKVKTRCMILKQLGGPHVTVRSQYGYVAAWQLTSKWEERMEPKTHSF